MSTPSLNFNPTGLLLNGDIGQVEGKIHHTSAALAAGANKTNAALSACAFVTERRFGP